MALGSLPYPDEPPFPHELDDTAREAMNYDDGGESRPNTLPAVRKTNLDHLVHQMQSEALAPRQGVELQTARKVTVTHRGTGETFALRPQADRIIVQPIEEGADRRYGSLYLPDTAVEQPTIGYVLAAGPGRHENGVWIPCDLKPGDVVVFGKHAGTEAQIWGKDVLFLRQADIMAVCDDVLLDEVQR